MSRHDEAADDEIGETDSVDFAAILRDDALIERLRGGGSAGVEGASVSGIGGEGADASGTGVGADAELLRLFGGARDEVHSAPLPSLPDDDALAAALAEGIAEAGPGRSPAQPMSTRLDRKRRWLTTVTAGAASVAVLLGGIAIAGHYYGADSITRESTQNVVTAADVSSKLDHAETLLRQGDVDGCIAVISSTTRQLEKLRDDPSYDDLDDRRVELWSQATGRPESEAPDVGEAPEETTPPTSTNTEPAEQTPSETLPEHDSGGGPQVVVVPHPPTSTATPPEETEETTAPEDSSTTEPSAPSATPPSETEGAGAGGDGSETPSDETPAPGGADGNEGGSADVGGSTAPGPGDGGSGDGDSDKSAPGDDSGNSDSGAGDSGSDEPDDESGGSTPTAQEGSGSGA